MLVRRINREIKRIDPRYQPLFEVNETKMELCIKNLIVVIQLHDYPFRSPKIFIDGIPYSQFLQNMFMAESFKKLYINLTNRCCCVCSSFACTDNWNACNTINHIIEEIEKFIHLKKKLMIMITIKNIQQKYNIPDEISIQSFLFE